MIVSTTIRWMAFLPAGCVLAAICSNAVRAGERDCLSRTEQSAFVAAHQVMPLAEVIRTLRKHGREGEVVRVRLCRREGGFDYVLTLLSRSGKVINADLNAANGESTTSR